MRKELFLLMSLTGVGHAVGPLWTVIPLTATSISVANNATATIQYTDTNKSRNTHTLVMDSIVGINQETGGNNCKSPFSLAYQQSCTLTLTVIGSMLHNSVVGGPVICDQSSNHLQCYQPSPANQLNIMLTENLFTVGGAVSGLQGTIVLENNNSDQLTLNPNSSSSFTFSQALNNGATYNVTFLAQPAGQTCTVSNGSGVINSANVSDVNVSCVNAGSTTLSTSTSELALSVTGYTEYGVTGTPNSGTPRKIMITNTGNFPANNLTLTQPAWPSGTTASNNCPSTLNQGSSCYITITPGTTTSSTCSTTPGASQVLVSANNSNTVATNVYILGYGCNYKGGFIFSFDDSTPDTLSVGGKVATTTDQATNMYWSADNSGTYVGNSIYGIALSSTQSAPNPSAGQVGAQVACDGNINGQCNTNNTYIFYNGYANGAPINLTRYAAGICKQTINSYNDWYLPAICEMGYQVITTTGCGTQSVPLLQNMQSNLVEYNNLNLLNGICWSSTEVDSPNSLGQIFLQNYTSNNQSRVFKNQQHNVRCVRTF